MIEEPQTETDSDRERLNRIANQRDGDALPEHTSWGEITTICDKLHDQVGDIVARHVEETSLTKREAQVWLLSKSYEHDPVYLTDEAIALVLTAPETPFTRGDSEEADEENEGDVTAMDVGEWYERAMEKYEVAKNFVGLTTFGNRDECLGEPEITWLDQDTKIRLQSQAQPDDSTYDDVIRRGLEKMETRLPVEEFLRAYVEARGEENIAQIVLHEETFGSTLWFVAYGPIPDEFPNVITETDAIEVEGKRYEFYFDEDPYWPADRGSLVTIYAEDGIDDTEAVSLEHGIEAVRERIKEAAEQGGFDRSVEQQM